MCSRFDTGGGRTDPRGTNAVGRRFPRGGRPTGPERRRKCEEAGRRSAEPPIRTGRPNAVASGCRKETAASPCGARPGGASSEARHREGTGVPDSCGPGSRRAQPAGRGDKSFGEAVLAAHGRAELPPRRSPEKGRADLTAAARDREGRSRRQGAIRVSTRPSAAGKATADRTGATTKTRRGGEAKCRASYSHRPAERGCKRMPEGNGRVPLRRTAGRSFLRGEAPRRDGRTRQLRPGIAKGEAVRRGESDGRQDRSDDENAKRRGGEMPSLLFAQAGRTRLQADAGRKRPRPLAAHGREELPPRRGTEKGRAYPTAAARDREGRSRRGGAIKVSARPSLRRTAGRSFLRGEAPRRDGRSQRIRSETEQADKPRKPETESTEAPLRHVGRSRRGCCCRGGERNRRARSEEKAHRRRSRNGGKRSAEETGSRRRTEAGDRPE